MSDPVTTADIQLIQKILPHRYPFLLVDRVEDIVANTSCTGIKAILTVREFHHPRRIT
jgi:3-hydroxyacyl-[acyl-carrier-protein] dehydratase